MARLAEKTTVEDIDKASRSSSDFQLPEHKVYEQEAWLEAARYTFTNGLAALEEKVIALEACDPACYKYPRLKFSDDKAGVLIRV